MEKKQRRVYNYVVSDVLMVSDVFETMLCQKGISYVHVDNEFHCFDKILRFYSFEEYKNLQQIIKFVGVQNDIVQCFDETLLSLSDLEEFERKTFIDDSLVAPLEMPESNLTYTKRMKEKSSKEVNDKLRQNKNRKEKIINRRRCDL
ncbi:MAG: hypothetical protein Q4F33_02385 [Mycoplasmatota bacterium]|nr:hypothetical protein [Mycoplasmatota bacterium]